MPCDVCGYAASLYLQTTNNETYCAETCMHDKYTEAEIEWLFDNGLIEWMEREDNK